MANHAKQAMSEMTNADTWARNAQTEGVPAIVAAQIAQTHATLELAEQQRVANMIALTALMTEIQRRPWVSDQSVLIHSEYAEAWPEVHPEILEALR
jgi:hypothetical protein